MIQFSLQQVALSGVDFGDRAFQISVHRPTRELARSIERFGLLQEPFLRVGQDRMQIVCGFQRLEACRRLKRQTLPAKVLSAGTGIAELIRLAITDNVAQRPLVLVEKARCMGLLAEHYGEDRASLKEALGDLNLSHWWGMRTKLLAVDRLHPGLKTALQEEVIGLAVALDLDTWDSPAALGMVRLFRKLPMGLNRQREMVTLVREIAVREACDRQRICDEIEQEEGYLPADSDRRVRAKELQDKLFARRFPRIVKAQHEFAAKTRKLDFGPGIRLVPPAHFEARDYRIEIRFQSRDQLDQRLGRLQRAATRPELNNLLSDQPSRL